MAAQATGGTPKPLVAPTSLLDIRSPVCPMPVSSTPPLTAQQSLLDAQLREVTNRFEEIQGIITLYHALGGEIKQF